MSVLHDGSEHCDSWVRTDGLGEGVELARCWAARALAQAPALGHECAVSERWSRQYLLGHVSILYDHVARRDINSPFATLTSKRKKVELMAEGHLAVRANRFDVGRGHCAVALFRGWIRSR
jgi:hypothetical protein